jgi:hypothetical protein
VYGDDYWHKSHLFAQPFLGLDSVRWYMKTKFGFSVKEKGRGSNETMVMQDTVFLKRHMYYEDGILYCKRDRTDIAMRVYHNHCLQDLTHHLTHKLMLMMETLGTDDDLLAFIAFVALRLVQAHAEVKFDKQWLRNYKHNISHDAELLEILEKDVDQLKQYLLDRQKPGWKPKRKQRKKEGGTTRRQVKLYHPYRGMSGLVLDVAPGAGSMDVGNNVFPVVGSEGRRAIVKELRAVNDYIARHKADLKGSIARVTDKFEDLFAHIVATKGKG